MTHHLASAAARVRAHGVSLLGEVLGSKIDLIRSCYDAFVFRRINRSEAHFEPAPRGALVWLKFNRWEGEVFQGIGPGAVAREFAANYFGVPAETVELGFRAFFKPPQIGAETPWHQDIVYADQSLVEESVGVWFALDDCDQYSGCLWYIEDSHKGPVYAHTEDERDATGLTLMAKGFDLRNCKPWPVTAGMAIAHNWKTLHYSGANSSNLQRRALVAVCRLVRAGQGTMNTSAERTENF